MTKLSIFVDESGDFGSYQSHSPYYIVTMVFHDQAIDLSQMIQKLDMALCVLGYDSQAIHTGPLIRREAPYQYYYDNGQHELSRILNNTLTTHLPQCDIRRVQPSDYRLFQVADMLCTLELLHLKIQHNNLSKSEQQIFHTKHDLKKDFLKQIHKKKLV